MPVIVAPPLPLTDCPDECEDTTSSKHSSARRAATDFMMFKRRPRDQRDPDRTHTLGQRGSTRHDTLPLDAMADPQGGRKTASATLAISQGTAEASFITALGSHPLPVLVNVENTEGEQSSFAFLDEAKEQLSPGKNPKKSRRRLQDLVTSLTRFNPATWKRRLKIPIRGKTKHPREQVQK